MRVKSFESTRVFCWRPSNLEVISNHMECKILLFAWMLFLLSVCVNVGNVSALDDNTDCYWSGEGPICDGKCRPGETVASQSHKNDGNGCIIGKKKYCCKTSTESADSAAQQQLDKITTTTEATTITKEDCYWVGKSPTCVGSCLQGDYTANTSRTANGSTCIVGKKKYCCKGNNIPDKTLHHFNLSSVVVAATTQRIDESTIKQMTNSSCYWVGHAPICLGSCKSAGDYVAKKSPTGDGGSKCESGQKKLCCPRLSTVPATTTTEESDPKTTVGDNGSQNDTRQLNSISTHRPFDKTTVRDNGENDTQLNSIFTHRPFFIRRTTVRENGENDTNNEMNFVATHRPFDKTSTDDNNNIGQNESVAVQFLENSVSTVSTHRPFHLRRRPTGQPNNSTVNNHLKIVKIKRKLVMSTPTNDLMLTSTPLPSSFDTTTTTSLLSLLSIPESTTLVPHHFHRYATVDSVTPIPTTSPATSSTPIQTTSTTAPLTPIETTASASTSSAPIQTTPIPTTPIPTTPIPTTSASTSSTPILTTSAATSSTPTTSTTSTSISTGPISTTPIPTTLIPATTSVGTSSTFIETESTSVATVASTIMLTTIPTTLAKKMSTEPFFNLPDVLPVPLIFRLLLRPTIEQSPNNNDVNATSTLDATTSMIQSSTTTTSAATDATTGNLSSS